MSAGNKWILPRFWPFSLPPVRLPPQIVICDVPSLGDINNSGGGSSGGKMPRKASPAIGVAPFIPGPTCSGHYKQVRGGEGMRATYLVPDYSNGPANTKQLI